MIPSLPPSSKPSANSLLLASWKHREKCIKCFICFSTSVQLQREFLITVALHEKYGFRENFELEKAF